MGVPEELIEIKRRLENGENIRKDFWRLVGQVKRLQICDEQVISLVSEIRERLFERKIIVGFRLGFALFSAILIFLNIVFIYTSLWMESGMIKAFITIAVEIGVIYVSFLVGRIIGSIVSGIGIEGFYKYSPLEFGVKLNYRDYLIANPKKRVALYSGALVMEHFILLTHLIFLYAVQSYWIIPAFFLAVNIPFSWLVHRFAGTGELHRLLRELRIMKEIEKSQT